MIFDGDVLHKRPGKFTYSLDYLAGLAKSCKYLYS